MLRASGQANGRLPSFYPHAEAPPVTEGRLRLGETSAQDLRPGSGRALPLKPRPADSSSHILTSPGQDHSRVLTVTATVPSTLRVCQTPTERRKRRCRMPGQWSVSLLLPQPDLIGSPGGRNCTMRSQRKLNCLPPLCAIFLETSINDRPISSRLQQRRNLLAQN